MTEVYRLAYAQVEKVISLLPENQRNKIPNKTLMFLIDQRDDNVVINKDIPLDEQGITDEAKAIIANLFRDYLAEENEKERIIAKQNQDMAEIFNVEKILENRKKQNKQQLVEYRKSIFDTVLGKIKGFLHLK